jgi:hypothetical protein
LFSYFIGDVWQPAVGKLLSDGQEPGKLHPSRI